MFPTSSWLAIFAEMRAIVNPVHYRIYITKRDGAIS
jgi:hypothetical protein